MYLHFNHHPPEKQNENFWKVYQTLKRLFESLGKSWKGQPGDIPKRTEIEFVFREAVHMHIMLTELAKDSGSKALLVGRYN